MCKQLNSFSFCRNLNETRNKYIQTLLINFYLELELYAVATLLLNTIALAKVALKLGSSIEEAIDEAKEMEMKMEMKL